MPALDYANCRTDSELAGSSRLATEDEYPPDLPGLIGSYVVGGVILGHKMTKDHLPEIVPITMIDKRIVGDGKPGPITKQLIEDFIAYRNA